MRSILLSKSEELGHTISNTSTTIPSSSLQSTSPLSLQSKLLQSNNMLPSLVLKALSNRKKQLRSKRQAKKDIKVWEKEQKKKKTDSEESTRKKKTAFLKAVAAHREEFIRFHKVKRLESAKVAKAIKVHIETAEQRKEREDLRAEGRRIQALKENDMEAYSKLVEETKNVRLQFLLSETDKYIATINRMVQEQQDAAPTDELGGEGSSSNAGESADVPSKAVAGGRVGHVSAH